MILDDSHSYLGGIPKKIYKLLMGKVQRYVDNYSCELCDTTTTLFVNCDTYSYIFLQ